MWLKLRWTRLHAGSWSSVAYLRTIHSPRSSGVEIRVEMVGKVLQPRRCQVRQKHRLWRGVAWQQPGVGYHLPGTKQPNNTGCLQGQALQINPPHATQQQAVAIEAARGSSWVLVVLQLRSKSCPTAGWLLYFGGKINQSSSQTLLYWWLIASDFLETVLGSTAENVQRNLAASCCSFQKLPP